MITGMLAVDNLLNGEKNDLWDVNTEREYHEEVQVTEEKKFKRVQLAGLFSKKWTLRSRISS